VFQTQFLHPRGRLSTTVSFAIDASLPARQRCPKAVSDSVFFGFRDLA